MARRTKIVEQTLVKHQEIIQNVTNRLRDLELHLKYVEAWAKNLHKNGKGLQMALIP